MHHPVRHVNSLLKDIVDDILLIKVEYNHQLEKHGADHAVDILFSAEANVTSKKKPNFTHRLIHAACVAYRLDMHTKLVGKYVLSLLKLTAI